MDVATLSLSEICYLLFGCVGLISACVAMYQSQRKLTGDERERLVRIDEGVNALRDDVADLKTEMRSTRATLSDHERRLCTLEAVHDGNQKA